MGGGGGGGGGGYIEYKYKSATEQGNGSATSRRPAIISPNEGLVRQRLYTSLALCDLIYISHLIQSISI